MCSPELMCRQHLLGEHRELHALYGCLREGISLDGYLKHGVLEMSALWSRHKLIEHEMRARGYNHQSPLLGPETVLPEGFDIDELPGKVTLEKGLDALLARCGRCRARAKALEGGVNGVAELKAVEAAATK